MKIMKSNLSFTLILMFVVKCRADYCGYYDWSMINLSPNDGIGNVRVFTYNDTSNMLHLKCINYWSKQYLMKLTYEDEYGRRIEPLAVNRWCVFLHYRLKPADDGAKINCSVMRSKGDKTSFYPNFKEETLLLKYLISAIPKNTHGSTLAPITKGSNSPKKTTATALIDFDSGSQDSNQKLLFDENTVLHIECKRKISVYKMELTFKNNISLTPQLLKKSQHTFSVDTKILLNSTCNGGKISCEVEKYDTSYAARHLTLVLRPKKDLALNVEETTQIQSFSQKGCMQYWIWITITFILLVVVILGALALVWFRRHRQHQTEDMVSKNVVHENSIYEETQDVQDLTRQTNSQYTRTEPFYKAYMYSYAINPFIYISSKEHIYAQPSK